MKIIARTLADMPPEMLREMARYRYEVFVQRLGWQLETSHRMELDEFDRPDTRYLIARSARGDIVGTARLLPTHRPYLLASVFPQLLGDAPAPRTPRVWELSRFAAVDLRAGRSETQGFDVSPTALALLGAAMRLAGSARAQRLVSVSPVGIERILRRAGVASDRMAPPVRIGGRSLVACVIHIDRRWRPRRASACALRRPARGAHCTEHPAPTAFSRAGPAGLPWPRRHSCC